MELETVVSPGSVSLCRDSGDTQTENPRPDSLKTVHLFLSEHLFGLVYNKNQN
jgi:hypothetical protein